MAFGPQPLVAVDKYERSTAFLLQIKPSTRPTREEVLASLDRGDLMRVANTFGLTNLVKQTHMLLPIVAHNLPAFRENELPITERDVIIAARLVELTGLPTADRLSSMVEVQELTAEQKKHLERLRSGRDDMVRLARFANVPERLFRVNLGEGDASRALPGALALVRLIDTHGHRLGLNKQVKKIRARVEAATLGLLEANIAQETGKGQSALPAATLKAVREALYALLLNFSRLGPVAVADSDPDARDDFSLRVLRSRPNSPAAVDDDDAPLVEATREELGVELPTEPVAALSVPADAKVGT